MRFLIIPKPEGGTPRPPPEGPLDEALFAAYMKYNEDLVRAGVLVTTEGLDPSSQGARLEIRGGKRVVVDGPYTESKELLAGFLVIEVASREEAIAWAARCPVGMGNDEVLELHQMTDIAELPPRLREIIGEVAPRWSASVAPKKR